MDAWRVFIGGKLQDETKQYERTNKQQHIYKQQNTKHLVIFYNQSGQTWHDKKEHEIGMCVNTVKEGVVQNASFIYH